PATRGCEVLPSARLQTSRTRFCSRVDERFALWLRVGAGRAEILHTTRQLSVISVVLMAMQLLPPHLRGGTIPAAAFSSSPRPIRLRGGRNNPREGDVNSVRRNG